MNGTHSFLASSGSGLKITFNRPMRGVAPGQYAVLYDGEVCLGSGMIDNTNNASQERPVTEK